MKIIDDTIKEIIDILKLEDITGIEISRHVGYLIMSRYLTIDKCKMFGINSKYAFENLYKENISDDCDNDKAFDKFSNNTSDCFIKVIIKLLNLKITNWTFQIKSGINFGIIYNKLNSILLNNNKEGLDKCYIERMILHCSKADKDILLHYTNSLLCNYMVKICNPKMKNKSDIETIIDPFCGTGGFLANAVNYLDINNKNINWNINRNNIYGIDNDPIYRNAAAFKLLFTTDKIFDKTLNCNDSLHNDYKINDNTIIEKVDIILSHMPYGLKNIIYKTVCKRIKELKIDGTKAEPLILQLMMKSLNTNGRCCVIVPDNLLLNEAKLHKQTRKYLIENLNVTRIISIEDDILNTGVKSSILYFINNGKTEQIQYSKIYFKNSDKRELVEEQTLSISYDDIIYNEYSLYINKYNNKNIVLIDTIKYDKLDDLYKISIGEKLKKENTINTINSNDIKSKYSYYNGSNIDSNIVAKEFNCLENTLIIPRTIDLKNDDLSIKIITDKIWLNENGVILTSKKNIVDHTFLKYYLLSKKDELNNCYNSKGILNIDILKNIMIPIPSIETQSKVISLVELYKNKIDENIRLINISKEIQRNIIWLKLLNINNEDKLKDIISVEIGSVLQPSLKETELSYKIYGGSIENSFSAKYNRENKIVLSKFNDNSSIKFIKEKFYLNQCGWSININDSKYLEEYIYIWLWYNQDIIFLKSNNILHQTNFLNIKIKYVDKEIQKQIINCFNHQEKIINLLNEDCNRIELNKYTIVDLILNSYKDTNNTNILSKDLENDESIDENN